MITKYDVILDGSFSAEVLPDSDLLLPLYLRAVPFSERVILGWRYAACGATAVIILLGHRHRKFFGCRGGLLLHHFLNSKKRGLVR